MNLDKVISGFFIILAMTLNFGFFYGDMESIPAHGKYELFIAIVVSSFPLNYSINHMETYIHKDQ